MEGLCGLASERYNKETTGTSLNTPEQSQVSLQLVMASEWPVGNNRRRGCCSVPLPGKEVKDIDIWEHSMFAVLICRMSELATSL